MMSLSKPTYAFIEVINHCENGITGNNILRTKFRNSISALITLENDYQTAGLTANLHTMNVVDTAANADPVVLGELTKSEFNKLYTQYFAGPDKPARVIYDKILNSARESCPFCGGIGTPSNLDHFLPQAYFPQFSILAINLVPACKDCNMEYKRHVYPLVAQEQFLQPYLDQPHFYDMQWVFAKYHGDLTGDPGHFEYFVSPPEHWSETDKLRVEKHFNDFDIAVRYAKQAATLLRVVLSQINKNINKGVPENEIIDHLLMPGVEEFDFINHWQRPMYQALINRLQEI
ncbi:hypothetical protein [Methylophaga sp.]|uniref:hypothetical protein n=1 Tax=Methylophaga sp. TaxID=2024840 RepID=UPI003F725A08